jgi:hypothetical protein
MVFESKNRTIVKGEVDMEWKTFVNIMLSMLFGYLVIGDLVSRWNGSYPKVQCVNMKEK